MLVPVWRGQDHPDRLLLCTDEEYNVIKLENGWIKIKGTFCNGDPKYKRRDSMSITYKANVEFFLSGLKLAEESIKFDDKVESLLNND